MKKELLLFLTTNYPIDRCNKNLLENKDNLFNIVKILSEYDFDDYITNIIQDTINKYGTRGYGYWIWKSYYILQELKQLNENDILVSLDTHCTTNGLKKYFNKLIKKLNKQPVIIAKLGFDEYSYTTTKLRKYIEEYLNYQFTDQQLETAQYEGGIVFIRNCEESRKFIEQWFTIMVSHIEYITDIYNKDKNNHPSFIDNRHDQSVVSLLYKFYNYITPDYLTWDLMHKND